MNRLVLASNNKGKLIELNSLLEPLAVTVIPQRKLDIEDAEETGQTFIENAILKARHAAGFSQLPCLADDSGIVVPALGGRPGIYSARFSGHGDQANNEKLLEEMAGLSAEERDAYYVAVIAVMTSSTDPTPLIAEGRWYGKIATQPSGTGGFGYDPLFIPTGYDMTAASMASDVKKALSHRSKALALLMPKLSALFPQR
ncbi:MAG: RdgB/HAM1 family non-canonical purine NTP pyrophosphatase [Luminiphilus sp.]|nr:RdgB/HAM1 family non-canonical purine NTP pyrophosphatase [Luminiphilus sp.]